MTGVPFINSQISSLGGVSHIQNRSSNSFSSAFNSNNYGQIPSTETRGSTDRNPSQYHINYYSYYDFGKHVHRTGTTNMSASGNSSSPNDVTDVCSDSYRSVCSSSQPPSCSFLPSAAADVNFLNKQKYQNCFSPQELDSCNSGGDNWNQNEASPRLERGQQTSLHDQGQLKDQEGGAVYTELQPLQRIPPNQITAEATPAAGIHQTADTSSCQSFLDRLPQMKGVPYKPTALTTYSQLSPYSNISTSNIYSAPQEPSNYKQLPTGNHAGLLPYVQGKASPAWRGGFMPVSCPSHYSGQLVTPDRDLVNRSVRSLASINTLSAWTARGSKNCAVSLYNGDMWAKFHVHTNEMIITKHGRRMFPVLHFTMSGLEPDKLYEVFVDMIVADASHWKFQAGKWVSCGSAEALPSEGHTYHHPDSPNSGAHWMKQDVNFGKLKLTNNKSCKLRQIILNSMHRYQPRIHVTEHLDGQQGDKLISHSFVDTQFIAVTAYQNTDITDLKVKFNPYARGMQDKSRLELHSSSNEESSKTSPGQIHSPMSMATSHPSFFSFGSSQNVNPGTHVSAAVPSSVPVSSPMQDSSHSQGNHHFRKDISHTYHSLNSSAVSPDGSSQQQNFLTLPSPHQLVTRSDMPQTVIPSSSNQQQYLHYLQAPNARLSFLEKPRQSSQENQLKNEVFQEFLKPTSFDIGHDMALPARGNTPGYLSDKHFPYVPGTSMWSYPSPGAHFTQQNLVNYTMNSGFVTNPSTTPGLSQGETVTTKDVFKYRQDVPVTASQIPDFLTLSDRTSIGTFKSSIASMPTSLEHTQISLNDTERMSRQHFLNKNELHGQIQQSSASSTLEKTFPHSKQHSFSNTWTSDIPPANRHLSPEGFGQTSSLSHIPAVRNFPFGTNTLYASTHRLEQVQGNSWRLGKEDMSSPAYSPYEQGRQQKIYDNTLQHTYRGAAEEAAAKEYDRLQREAAKVSLDFMSRDVQLVTTKEEHATCSTTVQSSPDSPFVFTSVASSPEQVTAESARLFISVKTHGNDGNISADVNTSKFCQSADINDLKQIFTGNQCLDNGYLKSTHFNEQISRNELYSSSHSQNCPDLSYGFSKNSPHNIVPFTSVASGSDRKKDTSEKRKTTDQITSNKGPRQKKTKLSPDVKLV